MVKKACTERERERESKSKKGSKYNRGAWTSEEDKRLLHYVRLHGDSKWRTLPSKAGLNRCGKSCRLRWLNYLRPGIKRGNISEDEEDLIIRLHNLLGNRWSLIAARLPGRTDNEIKNHWNTHLSKKTLTIDDLNSKLNHQIIEHGSAPNQAIDSSAELFDFELFNFSSMPDPDPDANQTNSDSGELGVEDYGFASPNDSHTHLTWLTSLGQIFDCQDQDYSSFFLD